MLEVFPLAKKMTKAQQRRMLEAILQKAGKLSSLRQTSSGIAPISIPDLIAIDKIVKKGLNRLK